MSDIERLTDYQITHFWTHVAKTATCWEWTGAVSGSGYGRLRGDGNTSVYAHRVSYAMAQGPIPAGMQVDHICHNRRCVRPEHLRPVTRCQNAQNLGVEHSHGRLRVRGVSWHSRSSQYRVSVVSKGRQHHGGFFDDLDEANRAAVALRNLLFTHNDADRTEREAA